MISGSSIGKDCQPFQQMREKRQWFDFEVVFAESKIVLEASVCVGNIGKYPEELCYLYSSQFVLGEPAARTRIRNLDV